ncbi:uncharacterized protein LOC116413106 [Galleria mellonella]|uniref:Uncharacterized protein LOC116413106 n=1 Tax=Galleria mellonella TaxID=7137 RepID=A0A6J3C1A9_GALME|nr:uncharacterized protein LOC116413106 [Galleria mellonella]
MCCCGCSGGGCSALDMCFSNIFYIFERLAACCAFTAVVTCIVLTLTVMLGMGVGLGYNYCFVDIKTNDSFDKGTTSSSEDNNKDTISSITTTSTTEPTTITYETSLESESLNILTSSESTDNLIPAQRHRKKVTRLYFLPKSTIVMPLYTKLDLLALIKKFREEKRNLTLELISL